MNERYMID